MCVILTHKGKITGTQFELTAFLEPTRQLRAVAYIHDTLDSDS
jgi:hypothetical protein